VVGWRQVRYVTRPPLVPGTAFAALRLTMPSLTPDATGPAYKRYVTSFNGPAARALRLERRYESD
jgi:hypothetical protein